MKPKSSIRVRKRTNVASVTTISLNARSLPSVLLASNGNSSRAARDGRLPFSHGVPTCAPRRLLVFLMPRHSKRKQVLKDNSSQAPQVKAARARGALAAAVARLAVAVAVALACARARPHPRPPSPSPSHAIGRRPSPLAAPLALPPSPSHALALALPRPCPRPRPRAHRTSCVRASHSAASHEPMPLAATGAAAVSNAADAQTASGAASSPFRLRAFYLP